MEAKGPLKHWVVTYHINIWHHNPQEHNLSVDS